jgi:hypothetical protein
MNKVFEHLPRPGKLISNAAQALDPAGGIVYVEVPDVLTIGRRPPSDNMLGCLHHHLDSARGLVTRIEERAWLHLLDLGRTVEPSGKITLFGFVCTETALNIYAGRKTS